MQGHDKDKERDKDKDKDKDKNIAFQRLRQNVFHLKQIPNLISLQ